MVGAGIRFCHLINAEKVHEKPSSAGWGWSSVPEAENFGTTQTNDVVPSVRPKAQEQVQRPKNLDTDVQGQKHEKHAYSGRKNQREVGRDGQRDGGMERGAVKRVTDTEALSCHCSVC